jgi:CheY-like chemotaxis protein
MAYLSTVSSKKELHNPLENKKVLIIEDFFAFRLTLKKMIRSFNVLELEAASTGEEALEELSYRQYDIILCDYNLGSGKNGQQVLEEARYREYIKNSTIFIIITAESTMDVFMSSLEYQADDYLLKPISKDTLERKLRDWIAKKENLKGIEKELDKKDYGAAVVLCDELINQHPKNLAEVLKLKGEILIRQENFPEAAIFYESVLSMGDLPWAMLGLGKANFFGGDYEKAEKIFRSIIKKNKRIVAAHDMLAKLLERKGDLESAQQVLQEAVGISPKAILRQRALGKVAYLNSDLKTAETTFKEVVKQGIHSILKKADDYTSLADVLSKQDKPEEGLSVLRDGAGEFEGDTAGAMQIAIAEAFACKLIRRDKDSAEAAKKAYELSLTLADSLPNETEMDLAKALYLTENEELARNVIKHLAQNNHDDQNVLGKIRSLYEELNREEEGQFILSAALNEIIQLNNEGVRLVREGKYESAIIILERAAARLPGNKVIHANAAHAVILFMQKEGSTPPLLGKALKFLEALRKADPSYERLEELTAMYCALDRRTDG